MDKHILFVTSEIDSTKKLENKQFVSFHKQPRICLNATVLAKTEIYAGMYAKFRNVDFEKRIIVIDIETLDNIKRMGGNKNDGWYKITNPQINNQKYCYIRTTNLLYDFNIVLKGAFAYEITNRKWLGAQFIVIHF